MSDQDNTPAFRAENIRTAFPKTPWPAQLVADGVYDRLEIERDLKRFRDGLVGDEVIFENRTALATLTPPAFRALFPFYLDYVAANPLSEVTDKVVSFLNYKSAAEPDFVRKRLAVFSDPQLRVIYDTLRVVSEKAKSGESHFASDIDRAAKVVAEFPR